jgi:hypothetical protein
MQSTTLHNINDIFNTQSIQQLLSRFTVLQLRTERAIVRWMCGVTPYIHLTIAVSVLTNFHTSSAFVAHVSLQYSITLCTRAL